jgi:hypothetical protein
MTSLLALSPFLGMLAAPSAPAADDVVMKAMRDELARSVETLQLQALDRPYFLAYTVVEDAGLNAGASFGAALSSGEYRGRRITVEVRVGDRKLDNTGYVSSPSATSGVVRSFGGIVDLPLDDDYREIRRQIWLATDGAYKKALEDISKKRAYLETKTRSDDSPDFSDAESAAATTDVAPPPPVKLADLETLARDLSAVFRQADVQTSRVGLGVRAELTRYVNSEGTSFTRSDHRVSLNASAGTQAEDGTPVGDSMNVYGRALNDLPAPAQLRAEAVEMGKRLALRRLAPHLETYNGPVLFEGQAAAELVAQALAPKLLATRRAIVDSSASFMNAGAEENPFLDRLGGRVLPEGMSVTDDPTRSAQAGQPLLGGYKIDDDGVAARETHVVENGVLKALLSTRSPVRGILKSTGNRRGTGPMPSNLLVAAEAGLSAPELKEAFLKAVKEQGGEYGLVVRRLGNAPMSMMPSRDGEGTRPLNVILAMKVFPDGREEPVRIAEIVGLGADAFKDIAAVAKEQTVYTTLFRPAFSPYSYSAPEVVSYVVPALLFKEARLRKPRTEFPRPPVASAPEF